MTFFDGLMKPRQRGWVVWMARIATALLLIVSVVLLLGILAAAALLIRTM